MREAPVDVADTTVLEVVRREWDGRVDRVCHLPVGFGAHHWRASSGGVARWFVTLDRPSGIRASDSYEAAYAAAHDLAARGLSFVLAGARARAGGFTAPCGPGLLSVTPWQDGEAGGWTFRDDAERDETLALVRRLHAAPPPPSLLPWSTVVDPALVDVLHDRTAGPWLDGPLGEEAR
jgi:spectinomycin phosphotransferase